MATAEEKFVYGFRRANGSYMIDSGAHADKRINAYAYALYRNLTVVKFSEAELQKFLEAGICDDSDTAPPTHDQMREFL